MEDCFMDALRLNGSVVLIIIVVLLFCNIADVIHTVEADLMEAELESETILESQTDEQLTELESQTDKRLTELKDQTDKRLAELESQLNTAIEEREQLKETIAEMEKPTVTIDATGFGETILNVVKTIPICVGYCIGAVAEVVALVAFCRKEDLKQLRELEPDGDVRYELTERIDKLTSRAAALFVIGVVAIGLTTGGMLWL